YDSHGETILNMNIFIMRKLQIRKTGYNRKKLYPNPSKKNIAFIVRIIMRKNKLPTETNIV
ncbi:MAG TPA: hypothetical protein PKD94_16070, partial [Ignavibacteria bacterium]|nr:hypothetical protein [Ignavibacteria bacterium]